LAQFHNVLIYLLLAAAVVAALLNEWIEAAVILAVVLINVIVGFIQEGKAEKALESIRSMLSLEAVVIRGSSRKTIDAEEVVPGDLVVLRSGDKVPADLRLLSVKDLRAEESPLTGESEDVEKSTEPVDADAVLGDRTNMAFSGTTITYGEARGVAVATGTHTEIGRISEMMTEVGDQRTPLLRKIDAFGKVLSIIIVVAAGAFFAFGLLVRGFELDEMFLAAIGIVVASIPEGLPAILTVTLALGVQRMAARNAIVRRLPSVETLGAVSVICSDKTGTLTRNEMTVRTVVTADARYEVEGSGYEPEGRILAEDGEAAEDPVLTRLLQCARVCNDSSIGQNDEGQWKVDGTATEGALLSFAWKGGLADFDPRRVDSIPFESEHKYMATLNEVDGERIVFLKGAPERVLDRCDEELTADGSRKIDRDRWSERIEEIAGRGERVLALAFREEDADRSGIDHEAVTGSFVFLGITGIYDPPRDEVLDAINECKEAGIRAIMITGDHAVTANAIARELGIGEGEEPLTGADLSTMDDDELIEAVKHHSVFARTNPEHKLRLVEALQAQKMLCGMTGDGVNDAPALKRADIGIAMGIKGTEVSKEAAEIVLTDDNFATIVHAVEEGRTIYDNIRKTILYLLPANGTEASVIIVAILLGMTLPISPVQVLWVNMVSAVTLALGMTVEPMERKVMQRPPRHPDEPILGPVFLRRVVFVSILSGGLTFAAFLLMAGEGAAGEGLAQARTVAVNMLVVAHTFYFFACRKLYETSISRRIFENRLSFLLVGVLIFLQAAFTYLPFMNTLFGTAPIPLHVWPLLVGAGAGAFLLIELEKYISRRVSGD
jgi:P-type Ca2+ transporter type 2C